MDDRTFYLAVGALALAGIAIFADWASASFNVPGGLWIFLGSIYTFLTTALAIRYRNNGKDDR